MAATCKLVWGNRSLDLTNGNPYAWTSFSVSIPNSEAIFNNPEYGEHQLSRLRPTDRQANITLKVSGSKDSVVADAITSLKLLVSGPNQIAALENEAPVYLQLDRSSGNGVVNHRVRFGEVSDGNTHFDALAVNNVVAAHVRVVLYLENAGGAGTTITLKNQLLNSDFTISSAGLATSWTATGTPTTTIDTTYWLINGQSQKIVATASQGIHSENLAGATSAVAYAWLYVVSGEVVVSIRNTAGPSDLVSKTISTTNGDTISDAAVIDETGATWYRVSLSGTWSSATIDLHVCASASGASTFYVDGCYLQTGTTTVPDAWSSYYKIRNRADRSTSNPEYVNYVDVWGVPGDMPAFNKIELDNPAVTGNSKAALFRLAAATDALFSIKNAQSWAESDQGFYYVNSGGTGVWSDGTGTTDNHYKRFTEGVTNNGGYLQFGSGLFTTTGTTVEAFFSIPRRMLALCRSSASGVIVAGSVVHTVTAGSVTVESNDSQGINAVNTWELVDLGTINRVGALPPGDITRYTSVTPRITVTGLSNTQTFDIDAILFLYAHEDGLLIWQTTETDANIGEVYIDGANEVVYTRGAVGAPYDILEVPLGNCWTVAAGNRVTRLILASSDIDNATGYASETDVTMTVTPRCSLLLGSQRYL